MPGTGKASGKASAVARKIVYNFLLDKNPFLSSKKAMCDVIPGVWVAKIKRRGVGVAEKFWWLRSPVGNERTLQIHHLLTLARQFAWWKSPTDAPKGAEKWCQIKYWTRSIKLFAKRLALHKRHWMAASRHFGWFVCPPKRYQTSVLHWMHSPFVVCGPRYEVAGFEMRMRT